jgi:hypothetical protein
MKTPVVKSVPFTAIFYLLCPPNKLPPAANGGQHGFADGVAEED